VPLDKVGEGTPGVGRERPDGEVVRRASGRHMDSLRRIAGRFSSGDPATARNHPGNVRICRIQCVRGRPSGWRKLRGGQIAV
jgi:hypothetical protein